MYPMEQLPPHLRVPDNVAVIVTALPFSTIVLVLALRFTVRAVSLSPRVIVVDVPEPAAEADPPLTEPILTTAVSEPS